MGTRSLTVFKDGDLDSKEIVVMYGQMDGYPEGHGADLREFLKDMVIVNGISFDEERKIANGMGCLAAQVVANFKDSFGVGGIYLYPANSRDCGEEYIYTLYVDSEDDFGISVGDNISIKVEDAYTKKVLYNGFIKDWIIKE
jgi:hypothetical protein